MLSVKAIYDGNQLQLLEEVDVRTPQEVIVIFMNMNEVTASDITVTEIQELAQHSGAFDFLYNDAEDIYTDDDLKVRYE